MKTLPLRVLITVVLVCGLASACATTRNNEDAWVGKPIDAAIAQYGPATTVTPNGDGKLYVWERTHTYQGDPTPGFSGNRQTRTTLRMFVVDANGVIRSFRRVDR